LQFSAQGLVDESAVSVAMTTARAGEPGRMSTTASVPSWVRTDSATASADPLVADGLMVVKSCMHRNRATGRSWLLAHFEAN
jgi:hypothetical protein